MKFKCNTCFLEKVCSEFRIRINRGRVQRCKECERQYQREWYRSGGERTRAVKRTYMANLRKKNPDKMRSVSRGFYHKHKEAISVRTKENRKKRFFWARAQKVYKGGVTGADLWRLWKRQRGLCALTGRRLDATAQLDHIIPKAKGGKDQIENLRWACAEVNILKRHLSDDQLVLLCKDVIKWIGQQIEFAVEP